MTPLSSKQKKIKDRWQRGGKRHRKKQERWQPQERSLEMDDDDGERGKEVMIGIFPEMHKRKAKKKRNGGLAEREDGKSGGFRGGKEGAERKDERR